MGQARPIHGRWRLRPTRRRGNRRCFVRILGRDTAVGVSGVGSGTFTSNWNGLVNTVGLSRTITLVTFTSAIVDSTEAEANCRVEIDGATGEGTIVGVSETRLRRWLAEVAGEPSGGGGGWGHQPRRLRRVQRTGRA